MNLVSLYVKDRYNDLTDFKVEFTEKVSLFVGINGSGKSSVLEAVAKIISWANLILIEGRKGKIDKDINPEFGFELQYLIRFQENIENTTNHSEDHINFPLIKITGDKGNFKTVEIFIDEGKGFVPFLISHLNKKIEGNISRVLPTNVIIYYSGVSESMHRLCKIHEQLFSTKLRDYQTPDLRALFYFTPDHFKYMLISLLCFEFGPIPIFLNKEIRISSVSKISIILKKPSWGRKKSDEFWGAEGRVLQLLEVLKKEAIKSTSKFRDLILQIDISLEGLRKVREFFITEDEVFRLFDIAHFDGLIEDISISLVHQDSNEEFDYKSLSEGEQQLITITGLNEILIKDNSLALMDEPDSYLHPSRQRKLIPEILERFNENCQIVVTTHSPFVAQSVDINKIQIFERNQKTPKKVEQDLLSYPVVAQGIFDIESDFSLEVERKIDEFSTYRSLIFNNKQFDLDKFKEIVEELRSYGEETRILISRELSQLKRLKKFDLNG